MTQVLMAVVYGIGVVLFVQDMGGRPATFCFVVALVLSLLSRYAVSRSHMAGIIDAARQR